MNDLEDLKSMPDLSGSRPFYQREKKEEQDVTLGESKSNPPTPQQLCRDENSCSGESDQSSAESQPHTEEQKHDDLP